jgi:1-acyl-sn-glycerol-3-phosphate acyltransferase
MFRSLCKIYLRKWRRVGQFPLELKKAVVIVAPHTSSADFFVGLAFRKLLRLQKIKFIGKQELFRAPFGFIFRWLGGIPVDRFQHTGFVEQVVAMFNDKDEFIIALSPEGTRKKVDRLKTGFYYIAKKANIPIVMIALDFENRLMIFSPPLYTTNKEADDLKKIIGFFAPIKGKHPELGIQHLAIY